MYKITHLIFDLDGTLIDSKQGVYDCIQVAFDRLNEPTPTYKEVANAIGLNLADTYKAISHDYKAEHTDLFVKYFIEAIPNRLTKGTELLPHTKTVLPQLRAAGYDINLVTSKHRPELDELIAIHKDLLKFTHIIAGCEVNGKNKPDPTPINMAIDYLKIHKKNSVYIGDSWVDGKAALYAGVPFIAVLTGSGKQKDFLPYKPILILPDLFKLPVALKFLELEHSIDNTINAVGGYWKPEFTFLRMCEELGEITEAIKDNDVAAIMEETADMLFVSSCLAMQYEASCVQSYIDSLLKPDESISAKELIFQLSALLGRVSRLVNHAEGPKKVKACEKIDYSIPQILNEIGKLLFQFAKCNDFDLIKSVDSKIAKILVRDRERFVV